jgi:hypothetical protein
MKRYLAIGLLVSLLGAADARAASGMPPLPPAFTGHLFSQVGSPVPPSRRFRSGFGIDAEHGYRLNVFTFGTAVVLDVSRKWPQHMHVDTYYVARGVSAPQRMQATFGQFGKISMRFRPARSAAARNRVICRHGRRFRQRRGLFVGRFRFKGEGGYVSLALHRAKGSVLTPAGRCPLSRKARERLREELISLFEPLAAVLATSRDGVNLTGFLSLEQQGKAAYLAVREESRGRLAIIRYAAAQGDEPFHTNEAASAAMVSPPAPFHGHGHYRAAPDGTTTWTGNLSVNFPGAPRFPLTGPAFETFLEAPL